MHTIPYGKQYINEIDLKAVNEALQADLITQGAYIDRFEAAFAEYVGAKYAVAVSNGTAALHLSTLALGVNAQSKVITTPITFAASANCVRYCGGEVVFADIDPQTGLLDIDAVRALLESEPMGTFSGIIPVDFAGYPVDLEAFRQLADEYGLWIIEDACHSPGGYFTDTLGQQQRCGNGAFADLAVFSFHPVKHIACGEGGMITTNRADLYQRLRQLRTHGITKDPAALQEFHGKWYYEMQTLGYNYRLTDFQAALGISQLQRAEAGIQRRRAIAQQYDEAFWDTEIKAIKPQDAEIGHAYHLYVIQTEERKELYDELRQKGIYTQVHYIPVHLMPYYQKRGYRVGMFPQAEKYYQHCLSLPMYPTLKEWEQYYIIDSVKDLIPCNA
ncbi:MAG: UDP-4-amino-4,6-dideoxy-N-acetyl-beta-L-altrosamine transaminase [Bacteroidota bacterium]